MPTADYDDPEVEDRWCVEQQKIVSNYRIGDSSSRENLGPLLEARAKLLMEWAEDDSFWD